jgi:hypothetical protein
MNIVWDKAGGGSKPKGRRLYKVLKELAIGLPIMAATLLVLTLLFTLWFTLWFRNKIVSNEDSASVVVGLEVSDFEAVVAVADSLGVPSGPAVQLCAYLEDKGFSGVGLFKVKRGHVGWLRDQFVPGAEVDLEDPVMNANIALGLISSFHARGYSWEQSFLIYVYGWESLAPSTRSPKAADFLNFVFEGSSYE